MDHIIDQMIVLTLLMLIGFICYKTNVMDDLSNKNFSKLIINIMCPAIILDSVVGTEHNEPKSTVLVVFFSALLLYLILPILSKLCCHVFHIEKKQTNLYEAMLIFSNVGFMGIPIVQSIFGNKAIFYLSIFIFVYNLVVFTYGSYLIGKGNATVSSFSLKDIFNAAVVGSLLGMMIYLFQIKLPDPIITVINLIGATTTPLAMVVIGSTLAATSFHSVFTIKKLYIMTILKLLFLPILIRFIFGLFISDPMILGIVVIVTAMPVASNLVMLCHQYGGDSTLLAKASFLTTTLSIFTIPFITWFITILL